MECRIHVSPPIVRFADEIYHSTARLSEDNEGFLDLVARGGLCEDALERLELLRVLLTLLKRNPSEWRIVLAQRLGDALRAIRVDLRISQSELGNLVRKDRITVSRWESGTKVPSLENRYIWCLALGLVCPPKTALVRVVDFSPDLLRFLQEVPTHLRSLTPDQFEQFVAERLDRMGYNVTLTGALNRKDGGIDLIAVPKSANLGSHVIAGQVKHHQGDQKTGRESVDRLLALKDYHFGVGLLATNTTFHQGCHLDRPTRTQRPIPATQRLHGPKAMAPGSMGNGRGLAGDSRQS